MAISELIKSQESPTISRYSVRHWCVLLTVIILLSGCATFAHKLNPNIQSDSWPSVRKMPIHLGIYYSPDFTQQEYARKIGSHIWKIQIGAKSVQLFDKILPHAFDKTSRVSNFRSDGFNTNSGMSLILSPTIEHFGFRIGMDSDSDMYNISYRLTLYSSQGVPVTSWVVNGKAESGIMWTPEGLIEDNLNDAAQKMLTSFEQHVEPILAKLANRLKAPATPIDQVMVLLSAIPCELPDLESDQIQALDNAGILCFQVTAQNETGQELAIRAADMRLKLEGGRIVGPSSLSAILTNLEQSSQTGTLIGIGISPLMGVLTDQLIEKFEQSRLESQFDKDKALLFGDRTLGIGQKVTGLVLFHLPKSLKNVKRSAVKAWVIDPNSTEGVQIEAPLSSR